jgi:hypothetical protein
MRYEKGHIYFDKLDLEGLINFQQMESNRKIEESLKRIDELSNKLKMALMEDEIKK